MQIVSFLHQNVYWEKFTGTDDRDDFLYNASVTIPARVVNKTRNVISKTGEVMGYRYAIITYQAISVNDKINNALVIQVTSMVDFTGATIGYQSLTQ